MHALLVTFRPEVSEQEFVEAIVPRMKESLLATPGLIMKTFIESGPEQWGAFYLFSSKDTADAYVGGEFFEWFSNHPVLSDLEMQSFAVDDGPSQAFGTPTKPLTEASA